jgi:cysteine-rich repeat protein
MGLLNHDVRTSTVVLLREVTVALAVLCILGAMGCSNDDNGNGPDPTVCGDGVCEGDETTMSCYEDCGCGNGMLNSGEECDGQDLDGQTCEDFGFEGGILRCSDECTFVTSSCSGVVCGDGVIEGDEECDTNNLDNRTCLTFGFSGGSLACSDTCEYDISACTGEGCGDGMKNGDEDCDGDDLGDMSCIDLEFAGGTLGCNLDCTYDTSQCETPTDCGDGVVEGNEECDDGGESVDCDADCTVAECGDATTNATAGEECDDGGESVDCNADCTVAECGDGVLNTTAGEECDGGGETQDCNADCTPTSCGDGVVNGTAGEECDDGNTDDCDGCDSNCIEEVCGDSILDCGEECDAGGETADCNADCTIASCGDGVVNGTAGEECDDGNTDDCDGCDSNCIEEVCGDGILDCGEDCDGGGETADCDSDCTVAECGDGVKNTTAGEECDDGNTNDNDGCDSSCQWEPGAVVEVLLVPDSGDDRIAMFDPQNGDYLADFLPPNSGSDPWTFSTPIEAVQAADNNIFVSDQINDTIFEFQNDGTFVGTLADSSDGLDNLRGLDIWNGDIYVSDGSSRVIAAFDRAGTRLTDYVDDGSDPFDVEFLSDGRMLLCNITGTEGLRLYDVGGASFTLVYGVDFPEQVTITASGTFLVASFGTSTVTEVDESGTVLNQVSVSSARGAYVLGNGNWLCTGSGAGVVEMDPSTDTQVEVQETGSGWRFIQAAVVPSAMVP